MQMDRTDMCTWGKIFCSGPTSTHSQIVPSKLTVICHHYKINCEPLSLRVKTPSPHPRVVSSLIAFKAIIYYIFCKQIWGNLPHKRIVRYWFHNVSLLEAPFHFSSAYVKSSFKRQITLSEAFPDFSSHVWITLSQNTVLLFLYVIPLVTIY